MQPEDPQSLIIMAGPRCAGKSTVIGHLQQHPESVWVSALMDGLGHDLATYQHTSLNALDRHKTTATAHMVVHYDFFRPWLRGYPNGYADDSIQSWLARSEQATVLTLVAPQQQLLQRIDARVARIRAEADLSAPRIQTKLAKLDTIRGHYRQVERLLEFYRLWVDFCHQWASHHQVLLSVPDDISLHQQSSADADMQCIHDMLLAQHPVFHA